MILQNDPFLTMAQNGPVVCNVNRGNKIMSLKLIGSGTAFDFATMVNRVHLKINNKTLFDLTMTELRNLNKELGIIDSATVQNIDFEEISALNVGTLYTGGIDTARGVSSFQMILSMVAAPADTAIDLYRDDVPPELDIKTGQPVGLGMIMAISKTQLSVGGAGVYTHEPSKGQTSPARVKRLIVLGANVTAVGIKKNGLFIHEDVPAEVNTNEGAKFGRTAVADQYIVDQLKRGDGSEAIFKGSAESLLYRVTTSGAGDVTLLEQMITTIDLL